MHLTVWATLAVLAVYYWTGANAYYSSRSYRYGYPRGHEWETTPGQQRRPARLIPQLTLLIAPLWLFAQVSVQWSAAYGLVWCASRLLYRLGCCHAPAARGTGFVVGMVSCIFLVAGTAYELLPA